MAFVGRALQGILPRIFRVCATKLKMYYGFDEDDDAVSKEGA